MGFEFSTGSRAMRDGKNKKLMKVLGFGFPVPWPVLGFVLLLGPQGSFANTSQTQTATATFAEQKTLTAVATATTQAQQTATAVAQQTGTAIATAKTQAKQTATAVATATTQAHQTATAVGTATAVATATTQAQQTATAVSTATAASTATYQFLHPTPTFTPTPTLSPTLTGTPTNTFTVTQTFTPLPTATPCNSGAVCPCDKPYNGIDGVNLDGPVTCFNNPTLLSDKDVFGMSLAQVQSIADYVGTSIGAPVSLNIVSDWKLSFFTGPVTYGPSLAFPYTALGAPKTSTTAATSSEGLLVVNGDLTLLAANGSETPSTWNGVIFCTGNLNVEDGCIINGAVIMGSPWYHGVAGTVNLTGSSGNFGQIIYNPNLVTTVMQKVASYREDISETKKLLAIPFSQ
jgi:hypothetical protein